MSLTEEVTKTFTYSLTHLLIRSVGDICLSLQGESVNIRENRQKTLRLVGIMA